MAEPATRSRSVPRRFPRWTASPWWIVPAAMAAGLLLFVVVWLSQRGPTGADEILTDSPVEQIPADAGLPAPRLSQATGEDAADQADDGTGVFVLPPAPAEPPRSVAGEQGALLSTGALPQEDASPAAGDAKGSAPRPVHSPAPVYPRSALRRRLSGEVLVRVMVDETGHPADVRVLRSSSHRALDEAALRAVLDWRFQPAIQNGRPVAQPVDIPVEFNP